jgi:hypothetical protein
MGVAAAGTERRCPVTARQAGYEGDGDAEVFARPRRANAVMSSLGWHSALSSLAILAMVPPTIRGDRGHGR